MIDTKINNQCCHPPTKNVGFLEGVVFGTGNFAKIRENLSGVLWKRVFEKPIIRQIMELFFENYQAFYGDFFSKFRGKISGVLWRFQKTSIFRKCHFRDPHFDHFWGPKNIIFLGHGAKTQKTWVC